MAAAGGRANDSLSALLFREPYRFNFFQAVRLLEWVLRERGGARRRQPVGRDFPAGREVVRFRCLASLAFPAGAVAEVVDPDAQPGPAPAPAAMTVSFLGLTGPQGALPRHYTALLLRRLRLKDSSLRDFLDLFNHRLVSLFYRAWEKYRLPFAYERTVLDGRGPETEPCTRALYSLVGLGTPGLRERLSFDDEALLYYAGHFAHRPRSAAALEAILADYFGLPVHVQQLLGQWLRLGPEDHSLMPGPGCPEGRNNELGMNLVAGEQVWDVQSKFRLRLGPLTYGQFRALMPDRAALRRVAELARSYVGVEFDFDVQLVLRAAEVPRCRLGGGAEGAHLGWNTWVSSGPPAHDAADAVLRVEDV